MKSFELIRQYYSQFLFKFFIWVISCQFIKICSWKVARLSAPISLAYDMRNPVWPIWLERTEPCDSYSDCFAEKWSFLRLEIRKRLRSDNIAPRVLTHKSACALKGLTKFWKKILTKYKLAICSPERLVCRRATNLSEKMTIC